MKITDLSADDQALVNTQFPAEMEKEAAEQVKVAQELYSTGFAKFASETADALDKLAEEAEKEEKEEGKEKEHEKKLNEEQKKEAAARGQFIARGFIDGLKKLGSERYGDEMAYLYPFVNEKLAFMGKALGALQGAGLKAHLAGKELGGMAGKALEHGGKAIAKHPGKVLAGTAAAAAVPAGLKAMNSAKKKD